MKTKTRITIDKSKELVIPLCQLSVPNTGAAIRNYTRQIRFIYLFT